MARRTDKSQERCAHEGAYGTVGFARVADGTYPAEEFFNGLNEPQQAKFLALFRKITSDGSLQLRNRQQFKQVKGGLFAFKRIDLKMRLFAFRHRGQKLGSSV